MVISGGNLKPDTLKPKEVVSLLLDDEIESKCMKMYLTKNLKYKFNKKNVFRPSKTRRKETIRRNKS